MTAVSEIDDDPENIHDTFYFSLVRDVEHSLTAVTAPSLGITLPPS